MRGKELSQLLTILAKYGVTKFKSADVEVELSPSDAPSKSLPQSAEEKPQAQYTEEDVLAWSVNS